MSSREDDEDDDDADDGEDAQREADVAEDRAGPGQALAALGAVRALDLPRTRCGR